MLATFSFSSSSANFSKNYSRPIPLVAPPEDLTRDSTKENRHVHVTIDSRKAFTQPSVIEQKVYFIIYMNNSKLSYLEVLCCGVHHEWFEKQHVLG